jgi:steroid 5-alpha reductase family enzyme
MAWMHDQVLILLVAEAALVAVLFAAMWFLCLRIRNYGFLDVTWTLSIGLLVLLDGLLGAGSRERRILDTVTGLAWSLRLGLFVLARVVRHHPTEDKRYRSLRQQWRSPGAFLVFFELQALIALVFSAPFLSAAYADADVSILEWIVLCIAAVGILGEALADHQAQAFKRRPQASDEILDVGLWRYSRHPNYFFEIIAWIGFALAACRLPLGWLGLLCPVLIVYFLLRVTGIPLTEKHSLETRGDAYREYQRRTHALIPWRPKNRRS